MSANAWGIAALSLMAWSYPRRSGGSERQTRWHVVPSRDRIHRSLCGAFPRVGALVRECGTVTAALRETGAICARCAERLAVHPAYPDRGVVIPFPVASPLKGERAGW